MEFAWSFGSSAARRSDVYMLREDRRFLSSIVFESGYVVRVNVVGC